MVTQTTCCTMRAHVERAFGTCAITTASGKPQGSPIFPLGGLWWALPISTATGTLIISSTNPSRLKGPVAPRTTTSLSVALTVPLVQSILRSAFAADTSHSYSATNLGRSPAVAFAASHVIPVLSPSLPHPAPLPAGHRL